MCKYETQQQIHIEKWMGIRKNVENKRVEFNEYGRNNFSNYYFKLGP